MTGVNRPMSQTRKMETKEAVFRTRKRILKYLVLGFLRQEGLLRSADILAEEAALAGDYELCDNIDLDIILQDYCSYYLIRFNKQPQFCRKVDPVAQPRRPHTRRSRPELVLEKVEPQEGGNGEVDLPSTFTITKLLKDNLHENVDAVPAVERKPLSEFLRNLSLETKQLAEELYRGIVRPAGTSWDDVKGLATAKSVLMESVVYPVRYPELFTGLLEPWRGVLLHGPPGSGKTLLARAVAAESGCTFFNVTCGTLVSKWRGDSERIVKILFELASYYAPSVVFIDEVETLTSQRSAAGEHEASRRLKAQLLTELDGVTHREGRVLLLANSNMPWEIDAAMLRRLEKRIYVPLPDFETRMELFKSLLSGRSIELVTPVDFEEVARRTNGYSGSDVKTVCKEALMASVRKVLPNMGGRGASRKDKLSLSDILTAIEKTKPVSKHLAKRHEEWQGQMGST